MKLESGLNEKSPEVQTVIPVPTVVPAIPQSPPHKWRLVTTFLLLALIGLITFGLVMTFSSRGQYSDISELDYELMASAMQTKQNFDVRIDIDGERCVESIHADDRQNIVTFHYTGENGREGSMAVYDFNQGLTALRDSNRTACFFANAYELPGIQLSDLQLRARNKQVMAIQEIVTMEVGGTIPDAVAPKAK